jgi:phage shock protein A
MPDTTIEPQAGGPYDPPLEPRVSRLEENMSDFKATCARIEAMLPHLATSAQLAELRGDFDVKLTRFAAEFDANLERFGTGFDAKLERNTSELAAALKQSSADLNAKIERLYGRVEALPTTWQMMTAIIAGQITLAGLLAAALFGAAHMFGHA